jgi:hypothetical protein
MPKMIRLTSVFALCLAAACGGNAPNGGGSGGNGNGNGSGSSSGSDNGSGSGNQGTKSFTCSASIKMSTFDYVVANGQLTITAQGQSQTLPRTAGGQPGRDVYGTWKLAVNQDPGAKALGLTVDAELDIEPAQVSVISNCGAPGVNKTVKVTSNADISDTSITILQDKQDQETVNF